MCLAFPETTETSSWNHPNFRAGKIFCALEMIDGRPSVAFRVAPADAAGMLRRRNCFATPYGRGAWASAWLDVPVDWHWLQSVLDRSYRLTAGKRLVNLLDGKPEASSSRREGAK